MARLRTFLAALMLLTSPLALADGPNLWIETSVQRPRQDHTRPGARPLHAMRVIRPPSLRALKESQSASISVSFSETGISAISMAVIGIFLPCGFRFPMANKCQRRRDGANAYCANL